VAALLAAERRPVTPAPTAGAAVAAAAPAPNVPRAGESIYRTPTGFRASGEPAAGGADTGSAALPAPVSVKQLIDSSPALPDTSEFTLKPYHTRFSPDYVAQPTIGYARDNFGNGFFGGTAISLSDILGNHTLAFAAAVNGRLAEAQVAAAYLNQAHRLNWMAGASQQPFYFYLPETVQKDPQYQGAYLLTPQVQRFIIRDAFGVGYYPLSRFTRVEVGAHVANINEAVLQQNLHVDSATGALFQVDNPITVSGPSITYYGPQLALVHDNTLFGFVGPFAGSRWRFEVAPSWGGWQFTSGLADWRRYFFARPFTLAVRGLVFGRWGRSSDLFPTFLGATDLLRGYTAGSLINNECINSPTIAVGQTGCPALDQLIGSHIAVFNAELRFPLTRSLVLGFLPVGLPPIEGALFYDMGLAWSDTSTVVWQRNAHEAAGAGPELYRQPLRSWGGSIRVNLLGFVVLRLDYTKPLDRPKFNSPYWTVSLGPTF
jgi:hypothetical protein